MTFSLGLCGLLIVTLGLTIGESRLAKGRSWKKGLIPIIILFIITTTIIVCYNNELNSYHTVKLKSNMSNGHTAEIYVKFNEENRVVGFTNLFITDKSGELKDSEFISFDKKGQLELGRYKEVINQLLGKYNLASMSSWDKERISGNVIPLDGNSWMTMDHSWMLYIWIVGPSLLIYVFSRWQIESKRKKEEMIKVKLESL